MDTPASPHRAIPAPGYAGPAPEPAPDPSAELRAELEALRGALALWTALPWWRRLFAAPVLP